MFSGIIKNDNQTTSSFGLNYQKNASDIPKSGRSRLNIPKEQIKFFVEYGFKAIDVAKMLCVSIKIVHRRLYEYNLPIKKSYTCLSDEELDSIVLEISSQFKNCGYKAMRGHLGVKINFMYVHVYVCM